MSIQQYFINKEIEYKLRQLRENQKEHSLSKVNQIAIFVDENTTFDETAFMNLQRIIKLDSSHFKILTFKEKKSSFNEFRGTVVHQNDINWKAKITSISVKEFISKSFDLLIDYTQADNLMKQLLVSKINASLKVGYSDKNNDLYDFMIDANPSKIDLFNYEMVKYLNILKLI